MRISGLFILGLLLVQFPACSQLENPCLERVDYSIIDDALDVDIDLFFAPPTTAELMAIKREWEMFDLSSSEVEVIDEYDLLLNRKIKIIQHQSEGRVYYGAVIEPQNYERNKNYPMMIWAEGLDQNNPMAAVEDGYGGGFSKLLPEYFVIIPSFRGQSLKANNQLYCSDGFFGDAYDGATDDALRFLQVALDTYPTSIDQNRLSIYGGSRGGTVALLAAVRYPKFNKVVSQAGPVQFHHRSCYERYGFQYRYQFLNRNNTFEAARKKAIKSSPIYFLDQYSNKLFIVHGRSDTIVPLWNAEAVVEARKGNEKTNHLFTDDGHSVGAANTVAEWIKNTE